MRKRKKKNTEKLAISSILNSPMPVNNRIANRMPSHPNWHANAQYCQLSKLAEVFLSINIASY